MLKQTLAFALIYSASNLTAISVAGLFKTQPSIAAEPLVNIPELTTMAGPHPESILDIIQFIKGQRRFGNIFLISGGPGYGKSMYAKALAKAFDCNIIRADFSGYYESENKALFEKIRTGNFEGFEPGKKTIVLIDYIDSSTNKSCNLSLGLAYTLYNGLKSIQGRSDIVVIMTTLETYPNNMYEFLFDIIQHIHLEAPTFEQRLNLLKLHLKDVSSITDQDIEALAKATKNLSCRSIAYACQDVIETCTLYGEKPTLEGFELEFKRAKKDLNIN